MQVDLSDYRLGAAVAGDLVNTAPEVSSAGDRLPDAEALAAWLAEHLLTPDALSERRPTDEDVAGVRALRSALRALITTSDVEELAEQAAALTARAGGGVLLRQDPDGEWRWLVASRPGAGLADELALLTGTAALAVLRTLGPERFRLCASPVCEGVFIDTSRGGRRRYCEPEVCGNRINVANYRARRTASHSTGQRSTQAG